MESFGYDVSVLAGGGMASSETTIDHTSKSYIGAGTVVTATRSALITADSIEDVDSKTTLKGGGLVDGQTNHSTVNITRDTVARLGTSGTTGGIVNVTGSDEGLTISASSITRADSSAKTHANGAISLPSGKSNVHVGASSDYAQTRVVFGDYSQISSGGGIDIDATATVPSIYSDSSTHSHGIFGDTSAEGNAVIYDEAKLQIGNSVRLEAGDDATADTTYQWTDLSATSDVNTHELITDGNAKAKLEVNGGATRTGKFYGPVDNLSYTTKVNPNGSSDDLFKEYHKITTHYFWGTKHSNHGGSPTDNTKATQDTSTSGQLVPGVIQAEDFDAGGEGMAYHDTTLGNAYETYRPTSDVDIGAGSATPVIAGIQNGEWLRYAVNVTETGKYTLTVSTASGNGKVPLGEEIAKMHIERDDGGSWTQLGTISIITTGTYGDFVELSTDLNLTKGHQKLRTRFTSNYGNLFNFDWLRIDLPDP